MSFERLVHLDFKGMPPSSKRLVELPGFLASLGVTGMLVEWEDTIPFRHFPEMKRDYTYSPKTVRDFLAAARKAKLSVIPLVQTFGHLESLLVIPKYRKLRERKDDPRDLCPLHPESGEAVGRMIDDVLKLHEEFGLSHFHLGADEVWSLGTCAKCRRYVAEHDKASLFLSHMNPIIDRVNAAGVRAIIWHDMARNWPVSQLRQLAGRADLMFWGYSPDPKPLFAFVAPQDMRRAAKAGLESWGGSAYKGACGVDANRPIVANRAENNRLWHQTARQYKLRGVAMTAWSRYGTLLTCSEPIESSWDSLIVCNQALMRGRYSVDRDLKGAWKKLYGTDSPEQGVKRNERLWRAQEAVQQLDTWCRHFDSQTLPAGRLICPKLWGEARVNVFEVRKYLDGGVRSFEEITPSLMDFRRAFRGLVIEAEADRFWSSRVEPRRLMWRALADRIRKLARE